MVRVRRNGTTDWRFLFSDHIDELCDLAGIELPIPYADPHKIPREDEDPRVVESLYAEVGSLCPADWAHANTIEFLPDTPLGRSDDRFRGGNLLFSLRAIDIIGIIDVIKDQIVWAYGPGVLDGQHQPTMLQNGNILVFDNGTYRGYSVVREIDPLTREVVWQYENQNDFFSPFRSGSQRLENGNTLICECDAGRLFEVTRDGTIVWDFYNPFVGEGSNHCGKRVHRATRYTPAEVVPLLERRSDVVHTETDKYGRHIESIRELLENYSSP